jgi:hypothetical protein
VGVEGNKKNWHFSSGGWSGLSRCHSNDLSSCTKREQKKVEWNCAGLIILAMKCKFGAVDNLF